MRRWIIYAELAVIALLLIFIALRTMTPQQVLGILSRKDWTTATGSKYAYYFEPKAGTSIGNRPNWASTTTYATINADTLNERFDYATTASKSTYRIAWLGDSFAYGLYLNTKDNAAERLEDLLNEKVSCPSTDTFEVINFGIPTFDIQFETERYRMRAQKYHPDLLLWFIEEGDFKQVDDVLQKYLSKYMTEGTKNTRFDFFNPGVDNYMERFTKARRAAEQELSGTDPVELQLGRLNDMLGYHKGDILLFSIPPLFPDLNDTLAKRVTRFAEEHPNVEAELNIIPRWKLRYQVQPDDSHLNEYGSTVMADTMLEYLLTHQLSDCTKR